MGGLVFSVWLVLVAVSSPALACKQFRFLLKSLKSCDPDSVLVLEDGFNVTMVEKDGKCLVIPNGCAVLKKPVASTTILWSVKKGPFDMEGDKDICSALLEESGKLGPMLKAFNLKESCPYPKMRFCANDGKGVDITEYMGYMNMALGPVSGTVEAQHDSGKSCFSFSSELKKLKKSSITRKA